MNAAQQFVKKLMTLLIHLFANRLYAGASYYNTWTIHRRPPLFNDQLIPSTNYKVMHALNPNWNDTSLQKASSLQRTVYSFQRCRWDSTGGVHKKHYQK